MNRTADDLAPNDGVARLSVGRTQVFYVRREGPAIARLFFRVGRADEQASTGGITHLVEHLALHPLGRRPYDYNGEVDWTTTIFSVQTDGDEAIHHLESLCQSLRSLETDRLGGESRILLDEAGSRISSIADYHASLRWGYRGPGLAMLPEFGLYSLRPSDVATWAAERFTAANVALAWIGPEPPEIELQLPPGHSIPGVASREIHARAFWTAGPDDGIGLSFLLPRTTAAPASVRILGERLKHRLRYELGVSYDVSSAYIPISGGEALGIVAATCRPADAARVRDEVLASVRDLVDQGPTAEEHEFDVDGLRRNSRDSLASLGEAMRLAADAVLGGPGRSDQEILRQLENTSREEIRVAFGEAAAKLILSQPVALDAPESALGPEDFVLSEPVSGQIVFDRRDSPFRRPGHQRVVVADEGIAVVDPAGHAVAIRYADCVGAVKSPSGRIWMLHVAGAQFEIDVPQLRNGHSVLAAIEAGIPREQQINVPDEPPTALATGEPYGGGVLAFWSYLVGGFLVVVGLGLATDGRYIDRTDRIVNILAATSGILVATGGLALIAFVRQARRFGARAWRTGLASSLGLLAGSALWTAAGGDFDAVGIATVTGLLVLVAQHKNRGAQRIHFPTGTAESPDVAQSPA